MKYECVPCPHAGLEASCSNNNLQFTCATLCSGGHSRTPDRGPMGACQQPCSHGKCEPARQANVQAERSALGGMWLH